MPNRPPLELGALAGDREFLTAHIESLVDTFSEMLGRGLELQDDPQGGSTDTKTFVKVPLDDPEAYLIGEHEISHSLFESDLTLAKVTTERIVERLLLRAGMKSTQPEAIPYKAKLEPAVHMLWNVLEDWRCCRLWSQLYPGSGELLAQRWKDMAKYDYLDEDSEKDLLRFLGRYAAGTETPSAPPLFQDCRVPMTRARNLVEGVDAAACLAITAKLVDEIGDALLEKYPPDKQQEAKQKLQAMAGAMGSAPPPSGLGEDDMESPPGADPKKLPASKKMQIDRMLSASAEQVDLDTGETPLATMIRQGAEKMEARLEDAKRLLGIPKKGTEERKQDLLKSACAKAGIDGIFVDPVKSLPAPTKTAAQVRYHLDQVKMQKRKRMMDDGDEVDIDVYIDALVSSDFDGAKFFEKTTKELGLELLLLVDLSGSMSGFGISIVEAAMADVIGGCESPTVSIQTWGFSNSLFFFRKHGSPVGARGVRMSGTDMVQALEVAAEWARASKSTRGIILMTDGMPTSCRAKNSTKTPLGDLHAVLQEMRRDGLVLSVLAIGQPGWEQMYDQGFGVKGYAMLGNVTDLAKALPEAAKLLVEAHIKRT